MPSGNETDSGLPIPRRYWSVAAIWLALTLAVLDSAIANIALPTIAREFAAAPTSAIWVINAYQVAIVMLLLPLASLGEILGYRRVYVGGLGIFVVASLGCVFAQSLALFPLTPRSQVLRRCRVASDKAAPGSVTAVSAQLAS